MMRVGEQKQFFANFSVEEADSAGIARMFMRGYALCAQFGELVIR